MSLITIVLALLVVGVALYLISLIPMDGSIRKIIQIVVLLVTAVWLLKVFGVWQYLGTIKI